MLDLRLFATGLILSVCVIFSVSGFLLFPQKSVPAAQTASSVKENLSTDIRNDTKTKNLQTRILGRLAKNVWRLQKNEVYARTSPLEGRPKFLETLHDPAADTISIIAELDVRWNHQALLDTREHLQKKLSVGDPLKIIFRPENIEENYKILKFHLTESGKKLWAGFEGTLPSNVEWNPKNIRMYSKARDETISMTRTGNFISRVRAEALDEDGNIVATSPYVAWYRLEGKKVFQPYGSYVFTRSRRGFFRDETELVGSYRGQKMRFLLKIAGLTPQQNKRIKNIRLSEKEIYYNGRWVTAEKLFDTVKTPWYKELISSFYRLHS